MHPELAERLHAPIDDGNPEPLELQAHRKCKVNDSVPHLLSLNVALPVHSASTTRWPGCVIDSSRRLPSVCSPSPLCQMWWQALNRGMGLWVTWKLQGHG